MRGWDTVSKSGTICCSGAGVAGVCRKATISVEVDVFNYHGRCKQHAGHARRGCEFADLPPLLQIERDAALEGREMPKPTRRKK